MGLAKMPIYKRFTEFLKLEGDAFDTIFRPRATTPFSGIYRCTVCGWEEVSVAYTTLPPQNHHTHAPGLGHILWRLSAYARHAAN